MQRIVLASSNAGKIREIQALLQDQRITVLPQSDFAVPDAEETATTFIENALIKARNAALHSGLPAIADDSGIEVDWLDGAPGVYSARYAGPSADDLANLNKLLDAMRGVPDERRNARFRCVMVFLRHPADPSPVVAEGVWEGRILHAARGQQGFGYDPIFWVPQYGLSSAELAPEVKNQLSHRGQALRALCARLSGALIDGVLAGA